jgi:cell division septation protein DedD
MGEKQAGKQEQGDQRSVTRAQLHAELMDFADRFASSVATYASEFENQLPSPQARLAASRLRFYPLASAFEIASGPDPGVALLDMVVLVTLGRIVWEEHWRPQVFGDPAEIMVKDLQKLEADIWSIAKRVLTQEEEEELRALILEWRQKNPEEISTSFVRFNDFGKLQPDSALVRASRTGGFFPEVAEAARATDEIRLLGDRAMYMVSRMQVLSSLQVNLAYTEVASQPEVVQVLSDTSKFVDISNRFAAFMEQLPAQIATERSAAIKQLVGELSKERKNLMEDFFSGEKRLKGLFVEVQQMLQMGNELAQRISTTVSSVDQLTARFDVGSRQESAKPFDIRDYRQILSEFTITVKQLNSLVSSVDELLASPKLETPLPVVFKFTDRMESLGETWMKESSILGGALILLFFITLLVYRIVSQRLLASRKGQGIAAILLVAGAACVYGFHVLPYGASSHAVVPVSNPGEAQNQYDSIPKTMDPPNKEVFPIPTIEREFPVGDESRFEHKSPDGLHLVNGSSVEFAVTSALHDVASSTAPSSISALKPKPRDSTAQVTKIGSGIPEQPMHPSVPESPTSTVVFSIHFESYSNPNLAKERVRLLKSLGLEAFSRRVDLPGKGIFNRVLVGTFENRIKAIEYQAYLKKEFSLGESRVIFAAAKSRSNIAQRSGIAARGKAF